MRNLFKLKIGLFYAGLRMSEKNVRLYHLFRYLLQIVWNNEVTSGSATIFILRLSAKLFLLLGLIAGVMSHLDFQYISIVAWSYICVYRPVFPVWRCKTLKSAW